MRSGCCPTASPLAPHLPRASASRGVASRRLRLPPVRVARPDPLPVTHPSDTDPQWYLRCAPARKRSIAAPRRKPPTRRSRAPSRRPEVYNWWRSDWNPVNWDAEEWFKTHDQAPWVEHTLALIEEGWDDLFNQPPVPLAPRRVVQPPPEPLTMWEIYVRQQVDKQVAAQAEASRAMWAARGEFTRTHHPTHSTDIRVRRRLEDVPNYRPRSEWSEEELQKLINCPPEAWEALTIYDPRFAVSTRGLRPVGLNEVDALRATGRLRDTGPSRRTASELTLNMALGLEPLPPGYAERADQWLGAVPGQAGEKGWAAADEAEAEERLGGEDLLANATEDDLANVRDVGDDDF